MSTPTLFQTMIGAAIKETQLRQIQMQIRKRLRPIRHNPGRGRRKYNRMASHLSESVLVTRDVTVK